MPQTDLPLVGYADPWSVAPGELVRFFVSTSQPTYHAEVVRLFHGDARPGAPGLKEDVLETSIDGEHEGHHQSYPMGSYISVADDPILRLDGSFTLAAWIRPTTPGKGTQGLLTKWAAAEQTGYGLVIDEHGELALWLGARGGEPQRVSSGAPLRGDHWYFVAAAVDAKTGTVRLFQQPLPLFPMDDTAVIAEHTIHLAGVDHDESPFLMGASSVSSESGSPPTGAHFNGKIEAPVVLGQALTHEGLAELAGGESAFDVGDVVAAWDFSAATSSDHVEEIAGRGLHGRAVNLPARGMTGHGYGGGDPAWMHAPATHAAIHFHDDDIEECGWDVGLEFTVPDSMASGIYAAKLTSGESSYHIPFFVRPTGRRASSPILFLVPTNSYLAYANFREPWAEERGLLGLYHDHGDGSPVLYSSSRRPIVNLQPGSTFDILGEDGAPHQFSADLYLVDWLTKKGLDFDVATDADLDHEGVGLLEQYKVVLTGSHPEYWTPAMLDGLEAYLADGGRIMYLGGNGLVWTTTYDPQRRHVVEVRRGGGGLRRASAGERYHSTTGDYGGYWRERGRASNRIVGVGSVAQGFDRSAPYRREPGSFDPRAAWIFEGVGDEELIGDFGLTMGGAAGFEIDAADPVLGTPHHALVVASATEFSPTYEHQNPDHVPGTDIDLHEPMRADMVFFETPNGGAVFSVGSIAFCGALSYNDYDNNVSRITENVVRRFAELDGRW